MKRFWMIQNQLIESSTSTCGFPEGDSMSIVAMLGVSRLWVELISTEHLFPHSFADNWSWATSNHRLHRQAMEHTLQLTNAIKLTIDWNKTWIWGTTSIHTQTLQSVRSNLLNDQVQLQTVQHARELGHIIHYQISPYRGTQKERHSQALLRLKRLSRFPWPIDDMAHMAQTACFTKALYGIETYACGERYFQQLRSALASVLVGPYANTNPYLIAMCASTYIKDPELYAIQQAIRAVRDFHFATNMEHVEDFFYHCETCFSQPAQVIGPAGALKFYLAKLSWQIDKQGNLLIDPYIQLHILYDSLEVILQATEHAWMQNLTTVAYTKKGQQNGPPIDRMLTLRLLKKFSNQDRKMILREIAGSFMDENQKSNFADDNEGLCLCCNRPDSLEHKVLHCDATEHVRCLFPTVVDHLNEFDHIHLHLPVVYMQPDWDFDRFLHFHATDPVILPFGDSHNNGTLYTDGSCQFPTLPTRWTSYAVVQPKVDEQTILNCAHLPISQISEQCFRIIAVAQGKGHQTIPRAELQALIVAFSHNAHARVVSDSSYALGILSRLEKIHGIEQLQSLPNFDLIQQLFAIVQAASHTLEGVKIKAHEHLQTENRTLALDRIGNAVADFVANTACKTLGGELVTWRKKRCIEDESLLSIREQHYQMLLALARERKQLIQRSETRTETLATPTTRQQAFEHLLYLRLVNFEQFSLPDNVQDIVQLSRFGFQPSMLVFQYLQMLKWPADASCEEVPMGISWLELYFNFQLVTGCTIPVNVTAGGGPERLVWMDEQQIFTVDSFPYHRYVHSFRLCVEHLQNFTKARLWPKTDRRKTRSLHILGCAGLRNGITLRPEMPYQKQTITALREYMLAIPQRAHFDDHPKKPAVPELLQITPKPNDITEHEFKQLRKKVRMEKRNVQTD